MDRRLGVGEWWRCGRGTVRECGSDVKKGGERVVWGGYGGGAVG